MADPIADAALDQLFRQAHSITGYLDKPVSETLLRAIWDLAVLGPTSANSQPLRVIWCLSQDAKDKLAALASDKNQPKVREAPVVAILAHDMAFYDTFSVTFPQADARSWFAGNDALIEETAFRNGSLGAAYLLIAARALGLDCGPMSGIDHAGVDRAFLEGTTWRTNFIMTMGYGDPAAIFPRNPRLGFDEATRIA